jgi:hypothetical protein
MDKRDILSFIIAVLMLIFVVWLTINRNIYVEGWTNCVDQLEDTANRYDNTVDLFAQCSVDLKSCKSPEEKEMIKELRGANG